MSLQPLIIQGAEIATPDLKQLAKISGAGGISALSQHAFRLSNADPAHLVNIADYCDDALLDFGFVPSQRNISDFKLAVMDMDSTLITIECIDELAGAAGVKPQVAKITESAMRGEMDFSESLRQRVALLAGLEASAMETVYREKLTLTPGVETMLAAFKRDGIYTVLVSGGFTYFADHLMERLGINEAHSNVLEVQDGKLTGKVAGRIVDAAAKAQVLRATRDRLGLNKSQIIAIGDGANDLKMMAEAGVSIAYRAKPVVREQASYAINHCGLEAVLPLLGAAGR